MLARSQERHLAPCEAVKARHAPLTTHNAGTLEQWHTLNFNKARTRNAGVHTAHIAGQQPVACGGFGLLILDDAKMGRRLSHAPN